MLEGEAYRQREEACLAHKSRTPSVLRRNARGGRHQRGLDPIKKGGGAGEGIKADGKSPRARRRENPREDKTDQGRKEERAC